MKKETDKKLENNALDKFGNAFLKTPRSLLLELFHGSQEKRQAAKLLLCLFYSCSYTETTVEWNGRVYPRPKGVWIGTRQQLADDMGMTIRCLRRILVNLEKDGRISITQIFRGISITVHGYAAFTDAPASAPKAPKETPEERAKREYYEMIEKINAGRYV